MCKGHSSSFRVGDNPPKETETGANRPVSENNYFRLRTLWLLGIFALPHTEIRALRADSTAPVSGALLFLGVRFLLE
jgi:hypothetical protein